MGHQIFLTSILLTQKMYLNTIFIVYLIRISQIHFTEILADGSTTGRQNWKPDLSLMDHPKKFNIDSTYSVSVFKHPAYCIAHQSGEIIKLSADSARALVRCLSSPFKTLEVFPKYIFITSEEYAKSTRYLKNCGQKKVQSESH